MSKDHSDPVKPERTVPIELEVLAARRLSPSFVRVTLGGGEIDRLANRGADQWFRLFLAPEGAGVLRLPRRDGYSGYAQLLATPKAVRPAMRNYTVRAFREATGGRGREIDVDFVLHTSPETGRLEGVAARWATLARPGDRVGILDEGVGFDPAPDASWFLLVSDETGLPAIAGVCASLPREASGLALIEIPDAADEQPLDAPSGLEVRWLVRPHRARPGSLAFAAARAARLPGDTADPSHPGPVAHAYAVGEAALATGIRRLLVGERGWPRSTISFCGYWRLPKDAPAIGATSGESDMPATPAPQHQPSSSSTPARKVAR